MNEQIDELLSEYLASHQRANRLLARGNVDVGGCNVLQVKARAKAKAKLQRLIVEARINEPVDQKNFVIEVTPEVMKEINQIWTHSEVEPVSTLHYSPYWKELEKAKQEDK